MVSNSRCWNSRSSSSGGSTATTTTTTTNILLVHCLIQPWYSLPSYNWCVLHFESLSKLTDIAAHYGNNNDSSFFIIRPIVEVMCRMICGHPDHLRLFYGIHGSHFEVAAATGAGGSAAVPWHLQPTPEDDGRKKTMNSGDTVSIAHYQAIWWCFLFNEYLRILFILHRTVVVLFRVVY